MFCSSGSSRLPNGRPYSIPTSRKAAASPRIATRNGSDLRTRIRTTGHGRLSAVLDRRRRATDEVRDVGRADEDCVDPGAFEREYLLARGRRQVSDRELAGGHVGQQVEDAFDVGLVVLGLPRREQEDLRIDPLERVGERLLV